MPTQFEMALAASRGMQSQTPALRSVEASWRGHWLDRSILRWLSRGRMFREGWGDLAALERIVSAGCERLLSEFRTVADLHWGSTRRESSCTVRTGHFVSPVDRAHLPAEVGRVPFWLVTPRGAEHERAQPVCIQLAATGDEGFERRFRYLARPLARHGIASLLVEQPYYGARRPAGQRGHQMRTVSQLVSMTLAVLVEVCAIVDRFARDGYTRLGVSGVSMGGQLAAVVAACTREEMATIPCLAPCTARPSYFDPICDWTALTRSESLDAARARLFGYLSVCDLRRLPAPVRPDAAVMVAASHDAYVRPHDAFALHEHWQGSELRWVAGGHYSAFALRHAAFVTAIVDAFAKLEHGRRSALGGRHA